MDTPAATFNARPGKEEERQPTTAATTTHDSQGNATGAGAGGGGIKDDDDGLFVVGNGDADAKEYEAKYGSANRDDFQPSRVWGGEGVPPPPPPPPAYVPRGKGDLVGGYGVMGDQKGGRERESVASWEK